MGDMAEIDAFWVALVVAYPEGEQRDRATAAIISQVQQVADGVPTFVVDPVVVLNNVFYREVMYQVHLGDSLPHGTSPEVPGTNFFKIGYTHLLLYEVQTHFFGQV
jgi:hypothetical protein